MFIHIHIYMYIIDAHPGSHRGVRHTLKLIEIVFNL